MNHDQYRHEHDKKLKAKFHWLTKIRKFWQSDINRATLQLVEIKPGGCNPHRVARCVHQELTLLLVRQKRPQGHGKERS